MSAEAKNLQANPFEVERLDWIESQVHDANQPPSTP